MGVSVNEHTPFRPFLHYATNATCESTVTFGKRRWYIWISYLFSRELEMEIATKGEEFGSLSEVISEI